MVKSFSVHFFPPKIWKAHIPFALIKVSYCLWNTLCIQNAQQSVNHGHRRCSKCCECCMIAKVSSFHEICSRFPGYNLLLDYSLLIPDRVPCWHMQQERRWYILLKWLTEHWKVRWLVMATCICSLAKILKKVTDSTLLLCSLLDMFEDTAETWSLPHSPSASLQRDGSPRFSVFLYDLKHNPL